MIRPPPALLRLPAVVWLGGLFALLCLPLLLSDRESNYTWDETSYHLPAVRQIREHWPRLDLTRDSLSATAPGYQYFLAGISFLTGTGRPALRLVNFAISLAVLVALARAWPAGADPRVVVAAGVPLAASNFFVKSAAYVVTDNAALLATTGALLAMFLIPPPRGRGLGSLFSSLSVFIRQSGVWLVAPLAASLLAPPRRMRPWWLLLPPLATLGVLVWSWGGLVPPAWRELTHASSGFVPAAGAYLLAVLALLGPAYYLAVSPAGGPADLANRWSAIGAAAGLALALAGANTPDHAAGRWGGYLWDLAAHVPVLGSYSPVFLVLAPVGGAMLALLGRRLWRELGPFMAAGWLAAFAAWTATALSNRQIFHRYYEPTILVLLTCWLLLLVRARSPAARLEIRPLAALGAAQVLLTLVTAHARTFGLI